MPAKTYARVAWTVNDILDSRPDVTREQAKSFLRKHESNIKERMTERGWEAIETLLCLDGFKPPTYEDDTDA